MEQERAKKVIGEKKTLASLGEVLGDFLRQNQISAEISPQERLESVFKRIVGPHFARHTCVLGFKRKNLEIGVDSSALMMEIGFHRAALLKDLQQEVKRPFIQSISFVLTPMQDSDDAR